MNGGGVGEGTDSSLPRAWGQVRCRAPSPELSLQPYSTFLKLTLPVRNKCKSWIIFRRELQCGF